MTIGAGESSDLLQANRVINMNSHDKNRTEQSAESLFLNEYRAGDYEKPAVAVDVLIFVIGEKEQPNARKLPEKELRILLVKRDEYPDRGLWALPGGFVAMDQSLEEAAYGKLKQKTGLSDVYLEQLYTFGECHRDPRTRVISCSYLALAEASRASLPGKGAGVEAAWFALVCVLISEHKEYGDDGYDQERQYALILEGSEQLKAQILVREKVKGNIISREMELLHSDGLAFDHASIIWTGIERLRNKLEYTPIAFSLMPRLFTLTELQQVYETILGRELLAANFRRKISHLVEETRHTRSDLQHRPARLFRFRPEGEMSSL